MMHLSAVTSLLLLLCVATDSFAPVPQWGTLPSRRSPTKLYADAESNDAPLEIPNDFKMFLTQCSIQSFMFLVRSMRDPQTVMWLEDFTQPAIVQKQTGYANVTVLADARMVDEQQYDDEDDEEDEEEEEEEDEDEEESVVEASIDDVKEEIEVDKEEKSVQHAIQLALTTLFTWWQPKGESGTEGSIGGDKEDTAVDGKEEESVVEASVDNDDNGSDIDEDEECPTEPEEPRKFSKLLQYHGLAALNTTLFPTWDAYFEQLLQEPTKFYIVESDAAHVPDYELEIDPSSLCSRIVSVREQISREFVKDLQVIANMGGSALESYWDTLKAKAENNETDTPLFERENLLFLELSPDAHSDHNPSPLRKGNFDLLTLLTTQEGIHRVLNDEDRQDGPERVTNEYLKQFYLERAHYFQGPQKYGRADDFLEELLSSSPRMITVTEGVTSLIDPTRIAELIMEAREEVALEWKDIAAESPKEHMEIQRMRLNRMMGVTDAEGAEESFQ